MITRLPATEIPAAARELAALLCDAVEGGSSIGFLAPLDPAEAAAWWKGLVPEVADGGTAVWVARVGGRTLGTVQLRFCGTPNGRHRAEMAKLIVHRDARGRGLGRRLLATAEREAADAGISLLVLDTQTGSPAERLYRSAGWTEAGTIPDYAADTEGVLRPTTLFHKKPLRAG
ncbi:GNAT family N-acetyltransferase [Streptomyces verrucosisporus]|uniref:GNAT family N-acetyltransferase n=1 Tax=Streptomyces verrucosisporus TaxID=1695161 RepID=UPI0019D08B9D|nr:GNAT family N-acetyltransferase [Streptomyces verrucosisporus]MBN3930069.1 GNAT family N-acetyltransferase [Streptomyces verrucosisporus]